MNEEIEGSNPENPEKDVFGSTENFFDALETEVNSAVAGSEETDKEVTPPKEDGSKQETHLKEAEGTRENVDWEKRYKDSTREAQKLDSKLKTVEAYMPILDAMKKDRGLVEHVRDYISGNVQSKSITEQMNLPEDFVFDQHEAMTDPNSDSARVMAKFLDGQVNNRVNKMQDMERRRVAKDARKDHMQQESVAFKKKHKMSDDDFKDMMGKAKDHRMSLDDLHYLMNRDRANANIANNTKKEMLDQMKSVRDIPTSSSGVNSAKVEQKFEDEVFDALKGSDGDLESLFGE
jgi:hypothetical protein